LRNSLFKSSFLKKQNSSLNEKKVKNTLKLVVITKIRCLLSLTAGRLIYSIRMLNTRSKGLRAALTSLKVYSMYFQDQKKDKKS